MKESAGEAPDKPVDFSRPFTPVSDSLAGATHGDNVRHAHARVAFMNELLRDKRVVELFDSWGSRRRLYGAAEVVARAGEALANAMGLNDRSQLLAHDVRFGDDERLLGQVVDFIQKAEEFLRTVPVRMKGLGKAVQVFVRETLELPWPWVTIELLDSFSCHLHYIACGQVITREFTVPLPDLPAPKVKLSFRTAKGETQRQAATRLVQDFRRVAAKLCADARPAVDRRPRAKGARIRAHARWYYECEIRRPPQSKRSLAKQLGVARSTVQHGINETKKALGAVQYVYKNTR